MNKTKIVILKVKKTERTIYDFNILKLDLIQENDSDKLISDYVDTFINECVEIVDIEYETFEQTFKTPGGEIVHAFGYYGEEG